jgi:hypothetical protein
MPRYVILEHDFPDRHWDLMLEAGEVLRTWRLAAFPERGKPVLAEASFDHRPFYLDYEGPITGGRGAVVRRDAGFCRWQTESDGSVELFFQGRQLMGHAQLRQLPRGEWVFVLEENESRVH